MNKKNILILWAAIFLAAHNVSAAKQKILAPYPQAVPFKDVSMEGELQQRLARNFDRLEEDKYQPQNVFLTEKQSGDWPGDTEGRTILGLVLDAQATHREPQFLSEIIRLIPAHLNEQGYMGTIHPGIAHEQQLSGNGWMLRGLCEYYLWKRDPKVLDIIRSTARNLFLPLTDHFAHYPIDPTQRKKDIGKESGNIAATIGKWQLSTDIGCVFIGLDGLVQAYGVLGDEELRAPIETLINKFLQIDLVGIKAQTHATLTACRALIRYARLTGQSNLINEAARRFQIYEENGMTENYENYNWFDRFDTWTEPCAIVDSYLLAVQLWQHTGQQHFLETAERIYYNALCHTQRQNGGFGCDNCPGLKIQSPLLMVKTPEAHWCCTMRGAEGLSRAAQYACFTTGRDVYIPFYRQATLPIHFDNGKAFILTETTDYPFYNQLKIAVEQNQAGRIHLHIAVPQWNLEPQLFLNGKPIKVEIKNGFVTIRRKFRTGDVIQLDFQIRLGFESVLNSRNTSPRQRRAFYGPLQLGGEVALPEPLDPEAKVELNGRGEYMISGTRYRLIPIYHLMDEQVWSGTPYQRQILF